MNYCSNAFAENVTLNVLNDLAADTEYHGPPPPRAIDSSDQLYSHGKLPCSAKRLARKIPPDCLHNLCTGKRGGYPNEPGREK